MPLRDIVTKDFGWKLLSLAMAAGIWVTVKTVSSETTPAASVSPLAAWDTPTFNLPVLVVSAAADVREFKVNPETVAVTVSGRPEIIKALHEDEVQVLVNLKDIEAARDLRKRVDVSTPPGVTLVRVVPPEVDVVVPPKKGK